MSSYNHLPSHYATIIPGVDLDLEIIKDFNIQYSGTTIKIRGRFLNQDRNIFRDNNGKEFPIIQISFMISDRDKYSNTNYNYTYQLDENIYRLKRMADDICKKYLSGENIHPIDYTEVKLLESFLESIL